MKPIAADNFVSIGTKCVTTYNVRRRYGTSWSYPMDWWITPLGALPALIDAGFSARIAQDNLEVVGDDASVANKTLGVLHHHDFPRDERHRIKGDWRDHVEAARDRNERRAERLRALLTGGGVSVLFLEWIGAHPWIEGEHKDGCYRADAYARIDDALRRNFPKLDYHLAISEGHHRPDPARFRSFTVVDHGDRIDGDPQHVGGSTRGYDEGFASLPFARREDLPRRRGVGRRFLSFIGAADR